MESAADVRSAQNRKYSVRLLIAAVAVIALGVALRPKEKHESPVSALDSARLQRLTQERRLNELGDYIAYASQRAGRGLVYIPELQQSAVVIGASTLATALHPGVPASVSAVPMGGAPVKLNFHSRRPDVPVLLMYSPPEVSLPAPPAATVDTGDWVLAVGLREDGNPLFAYGLYENAADARCGSFTYKRLRASIPLTSALLGGGMFTLRGELAGVVAHCDSEIVVLSIDSITAALKQPVAPNAVLQDLYGIRVAAAAAASGVDVLSVWKTTPAEQARVLAGDRIMAIDSEKVNTPEEVLALLASEGPHALTVRRGRRDVTLTLAPKVSLEPVRVDALGLVLLDSASGVTVRSVSENSAAAHAGILPGDILRRAGTANVESAAAVAEYAARGAAPLRLALERKGAEFEVQVTP